MEALLGLRVCDPAMGSGHFLVHAVDYLTERLITILNEYPENPVLRRIETIRGRIREELDEQGITLETDTRRAAPLRDTNLLKRMVMKRCIYGVDLNPMAVELAKLSLWLDSFTVGAPLSFLNHHLKTGNSLIGTTVPEAKAALAREGAQYTVFGGPFVGLLRATELMREVALRTDATFEEVTASTQKYAAFERAMQPYKQILDLWTSRHFGNVRAEDLLRSHGGAVLDALKNDPNGLDEKQQATLQKASVRRRAKHFFHWELEFPEVFVDLDRARWKENPGFDAVIGNPPYGDILDEGEKKYLKEQKTGGRAEVYANFVFRASRLMKPECHLGFIIPNTMLDGAQFSVFRERLTEKAVPSEIRDFRSKEVFAEADVLTMLLFMEKRVAQQELMIPYDYWDAQDGGFSEAKIKIKPGSKDPWRMTNAVMEQIERSGLAVSLEPSIGSCHDAGVDYKWKGVGWQNRGERQPLSEALFYEGEKRHEDDFALLKGADIDRYSSQHSGNYLIHKYEELRSPENTILVYRDLAEVPTKILTRQTSDRIQAVVDENQHVTSKSIHTTLVRAEPYSENYVIALLNSALLTHVYGVMTGEAGRAFAQVKLYDLRQLPIREIAFTTPEGTREDAVAEAVAAYEEAVEGAASGIETPRRGVSMGEEATVLALVEDHLAAEPERADVVHDLLAHLAEEMTRLHADRQVYDLDALAYIGERTDGPKLPDLGVYQPAQHRAALLEATTEDREKLRIGRVEAKRDGNAVTIRATVRYKPADPDAAVDRWGYTETAPLEAFRLANLSDAEAALVEHFVPAATERGKGFADFRKNAAKTKAPLYRLKALQLPDPQRAADDVRRYVEAKAAADALDAKIAATDRLIDCIVYRLYDLTDEEIAVVEGRE